MDLLLYAPLWFSVCMYGRRGVMHLLLLHLSCSIPGSGYFFLILCVSMCLLYVCMWCGVVGLLSLSFSLDRRGDVGSFTGQQSSGRGTMAGLQLPICWRIGVWGSHHRSTDRDILAHPNLSCCSQPSCFICWYTVLLPLSHVCRHDSAVYINIIVDCINQCIMVSPFRVHPLIHVHKQHDMNMFQVLIIVDDSLLALS